MPDHDCTDHARVIGTHVRVHTGAREPIERAVAASDLSERTPRSVCSENGMREPIPIHEHDGGPGPHSRDGGAKAEVMDRDARAGLVGYGLPATASSARDRYTADRRDQAKNDRRHDPHPSERQYATHHDPLFTRLSRQTLHRPERFRS